MDIITIDFETYYDQEYSLSKMTTEAYVRDDRFEVIGVGVKINSEPTDTYSGEDVGGFLRSLNYKNAAVLAHNTVFDGAILRWRYDIEPKFWLDTLSMSRPEFKMCVGGSLAALAWALNLGEKGTEVVQAKGKRRADFTPQELDAYMGYCANDVELTYKLYQVLKSKLPPSELLMIDLLIRMYVDPLIEVDVDHLRGHLHKVVTNKEQLLNKLSKNDPERIRKVLSSNNKFADLLKLLGVTPPTKISKTTGKTTYAFAKTDRGLLDLQEHPDQRVQAVVAARLGVKSTIEETRTQSLIEAGQRGRLPVMLNYHGAHTGRLSGGDGLNLQNLPSRRGKAIREAICAPDGHVLMVGDLSQIEARLSAYLAGEDRLVEAFRQGRDVYSEFASNVYGRTITKADKRERFVGKTCLGADTKVLTRRGWTPILEVRTTDQLWDGVEWVNHQGVSYMGQKPTINLHGLELTTDHEILTDRTKWATAQYVHDHKAVFQSALDSAILPSLDTKNTYRKGVRKIGVGDHYVDVVGVRAFTRTMDTIFGLVDQLRVTLALRERLLTRGTGNISLLWKTIYTALGSLIDYLARYLGATTHLTECLSTTAVGESAYTNLGARTGRSSYDTYRLYPVGMNQLTRWIGSTLTRAMNRGTYGFALGAQTYETNEKSTILKPVYDILNSGSRNRFTVLTEAGPIIVHNCILGLQYGMGSVRLKETLALGQGGMTVDIDVEEALRIVKTYRNTYMNIAKLWRICDHILKKMTLGEYGDFAKVLKYNSTGIRMTNGLYITYPALRSTSNSFVYVNNPRDYRKLVKGRLTGNTDDVEFKSIWGGSVVENFTQGQAGVLMKEMMIRLYKKYPCVLQVHDELICVVPEDEIDYAEAYMRKIMSTPPKWAPDLPVACEVGYHKRYGKVVKT